MLIQPLLMEEESHSLETVAPVKQERTGRARLHLKLYQADTGSYFGSSKHNYFLRQKNYFSKAKQSQRGGEGKGIFNLTG